MLPEFAFMEPLSSAVVSEVTIIRPAVFSLCDPCVSKLLFEILPRVCTPPWLCHSVLCKPLVLHQVGYWPLCRMSLEEADDAALGIVRLSEPGENWNP